MELPIKFLEQNKAAVYGVECLQFWRRTKKQMFWHGYLDQSYTLENEAFWELAMCQLV